MLGFICISTIWGSVACQFVRPPPQNSQHHFRALNQWSGSRHHCRHSVRKWFVLLCQWNSATNQPQRCPVSFSWCLTLPRLTLMDYLHPACFIQSFLNTFHEDDFEFFIDIYLATWSSFMWCIYLTKEMICISICALSEIWIHGMLYLLCYRSI